MHGGLCLETIIVDENQEVKLRDLCYEEISKQYYPYSSKQMDEDFRALGYLILECATFKTISEIR